MIQITQRSVQAFTEVVGALLQNARDAGVWEVPIQDQTGAQVATLVLHDLPKRPKDMPRAMRPKQKLSKRQRDAAKRSKIRSEVAA